MKYFICAMIVALCGCGDNATSKVVTDAGSEVSAPIEVVVDAFPDVSKVVDAGVEAAVKPNPGTFVLTIDGVDQPTINKKSYYIGTRLYVNTDIDKPTPDPPLLNSVSISMPFDVGEYVCDNSEIFVTYAIITPPDQWIQMMKSHECTISLTRVDDVGGLVEGSFTSTVFDFFDASSTVSNVLQGTFSVTRIKIN